MIFYKRWYFKNKWSECNRTLLKYKEISKVSFPSIINNVLVLQKSPHENLKQIKTVVHLKLLS